MDVVFSLFWDTFLQGLLFMVQIAAVAIAAAPFAVAAAWIARRTFL